MSKLTEALKQKYGTPLAAVRALGLDEKLLKDSTMKANASRISPQVYAAIGGLTAHLRPRLAQDSSLNALPQLVRRATSERWSRGKLVAELTRKYQPLLAQDQELGDVEGNLIRALQAAEMANMDPDAPPAVVVPPAVLPPNSSLPAWAREDPEEAADQSGAQIEQWLAANFPDVLAQAKQELAPAPEAPPQVPPPEAAQPPEKAEDEPSDEDDDRKKGMDEEEDEDVDSKKPKGAQDKVGNPARYVTRKAMDEAIADAETRAFNNARAVRDAERFVRPWVGDIAMDAKSPEDVYERALTMKGIKVEGVPRAAFRAMLALVPKNSARQHSVPAMAADAAGGQDDGGFLSRFPGAAKIKLGAL